MKKCNYHQKIPKGITERGINNITSEHLTFEVKSNLDSDIDNTHPPSGHKSHSGNNSNEDIGPKKPVTKKPPLKNGGKICDRDKLKKPPSGNAWKVQKNKKTTTTPTPTTMRYKGAVIAFQPVYQIVRNKLSIGFISTFFPYLTGQQVVGPVYGTLPLFARPRVGPTVISSLFGGHLSEKTKMKN
ncbi:hypothetical protein M8J75_005024 [Diaphorina citri]|nr:hypothetical protein M8J75_005024 [Diaphorina citri]